VDTAPGNTWSRTTGPEVAVRLSEISDAAEHLRAFRRFFRIGIPAFVLWTLILIGWQIQSFGPSLIGAGIVGGNVLIVFVAVRSYRRSTSQLRAFEEERERLERRSGEGSDRA
jgi:hypothetical protein